MSHQKPIPKVTFHLNAGIPTSKVLDLVDKEPKGSLTIDYDRFNFFSYITLEDATQEEIDTFKNKLNNIYPLEVDFDYTPRPQAKPLPKKDGKLVFPTEFFKDPNK